MKIKEYLENKKIYCEDFKLINQAFTHSSYVNEHKKVNNDNERLEFMGDAVLQIWVSDRLMRLQTPLSEGKMTTLRSQLVCETSLAKYCRELELQQFLKLGIGEEKTGGRNRNSILADMFEALLGAIYLTLSMKEIDIILDEVISPYLINPLNTIIVDYKTKLQEFVQADLRKSVVYEVVSTKGPSNKPIFEICVKMDDIILGVGSGNSKKVAEQMAASNAFEKLAN